MTEEARQKAEKEAEKDEMETDHPPAPGEDKSNAASTELTAQTNGAEMDVDPGSAAHREESKERAEQERKEEAAPMQPDDEDAVEY